jgi:hypothetical protein
MKLQMDLSDLPAKGTPSVHTSRPCNPVLILGETQGCVRPCLVSKKFAKNFRFFITSNLVVHV